VTSLKALLWWWLPDTLADNRQEVDDAKTSSSVYDILIGAMPT